MVHFKSQGEISYFNEMNRRNIGFPTLLFRETFSRNEMEWKYVQKEK